MLFQILYEGSSIIFNILAIMATVIIFPSISYFGGNPSNSTDSAAWYLLMISVGISTIAVCLGTYVAVIKRGQTTLKLGNKRQVCTP